MANAKSDAKDNAALEDYDKGKLVAMDRVQAIIEFKIDGTIVTANENFLNAVGYTLEEIQGKHHSMFVEPAFANSIEYRQLWEKLGRGDFEAGEFKRLRKDGSEIWINASYNPVFDSSGDLIGVVKFATDVTAQKLDSADKAGQLEAIGKSQAVIEFEMDGTIISANENFLNTLGYRLDEIQGQHHSMFVETDYGRSPEYRAFWDKLGRGEFEAGEFKRIGRDGREVWINASYNPIFDMNGKPFKVVKYATDVTAQKLDAADKTGQIEAINKAQAVIEFEMDGTVRHANENFLAALGYRLEQIKGQHHSMFVEAEYGRSTEYKAFWEKLNRGDFVADEFKRVRQDGSDIWINASYNPIFDMNGKPFKVVKYATDITAQKRAVIEISNILGYMAEGDLSVRIENELGGEFEKVRSDLNSTLEKMHGKELSEKEVQKEIDQIVQSAAAGDFSTRVGLEGKDGFMLALAESMNGLCGQIDGAMSEISAMFGGLAEGDLSVRIENEYQGALEELKNNANDTVERLSVTVSEILAATEEVAAAASQISEGTNDLSSRTEQQASNLEETAASMEQIAVTVKQNAENAQHANNLSAQARDLAETGGTVVASAVEAMSKISQSSTKISEINSVIDGIAFQTNLLALNAAVEAARAGEAGRGFAVVASEVRSLAQRSSEAAKDINNLISQSSVQVQDGVDLVNKTGESLTEIVGSIKQVTDIVSEIAAASNEQATGIEEVNTAVTHMDEMTQQNSALVEENAAAANSLQDQAQGMSDQMAFFRMEEDVVQPRVQNSEKVKRHPNAGKRPRRGAQRATGSARQLQSNLATAVELDDDWKEF